MDRSSIAGLLPRFHLFSELDPEQIAQVAAQSQFISVPRGKALFNRGDPAHGIYLLISGQIKLAVTSPQGTEKIIGIISAGESFGEAIIFLDRPFFPIQSQATVDAQLLMIPKSLIFDLLARDTSVARKMLAGLSMRNHQLVHDIESVALLSCSQRLIGYLLQIAGDAPEGAHLTLPSSKTNIASLLNLTPETLSRTMLKLQQAGLIEVRGKDITILDVEGLRRFECNL
jgi:CRP-like cAMP-binding protein